MCRTYDRRDTRTRNEVAGIWLDILIKANRTDEKALAQFRDWIKAQPPLFFPTTTRLIRVASRTQGLEPIANEYSRVLLGLIRDEREDAEEKARSYVALARAILPVDRGEAKEYFDEAVRVASRIGDENLARWSAILKLAEAAVRPGVPQPEAAYMLARAAELTYSYGVRDKHFEWERTVEAIVCLCPASSLAILSRWRDRGFGWDKRLLPIAVRLLVKRGDLNARVALPLAGVRADWNSVELLQACLAACTTRAEKENAAAFAFGYFRLDTHSSDVWESLGRLLREHLLPTNEIDKVLTAGQGKPRSQRINSTQSTAPWRNSRDGDERDWEGVFAGIDLGCATDLALAYQRFRETGVPHGSDLFFLETFRRVTPGHETEFIAAIRDTRDLEPYYFRRFVENFPEDWKNKLTIQRAFRDTLRVFCGRFCLEISKGPYYETFPFAKACHMARVNESELVDYILGPLGEVTDYFEPKRLFSLVDLLAVKLSDSDALGGLMFGLDLFEGLLEEADGDGPWDLALSVSGTAEQGLAGYVWAGLASPHAGLRWEMAHVVRGMCTLQRDDFLGHIVALSKESSGGPFADSRLQFYLRHAKQWLLIALARAANDSPEALVRHASFLFDLALKGEPHVMIRGLAAKASLELFDRGLLDAQPELQAGLKAVNLSPLPVVTSKSYNRSRHGRANTDDRDEGDPFHFGMDVDSLLFGSLGECFGACESEVEGLARQVVKKDWGYEGKNGWEHDQRRIRGIFREGQTYANKSYPSTDDLGFYFAYHSTMIVAGRMLATRALHNDPDWPRDEFAHWMCNHGISRSDGYWLADRRDPAPLHWPAWKSEKEGDHWPWSIARSDFDKVLIQPDGRLNLWGRWNTVEGRRNESVSIRSALVEPRRSEALMRALQTTDPFRYCLPEADSDDAQIECGEFRLKGWITHPYREPGLDRFDPWAGDIRYPAMSPSGFVKDLLDLRSDREGRLWRPAADASGQSSLRVETWGDAVVDREREDRREKGSRLHVSREFLREFLPKACMDLIITVELDRDLIRSYYGDTTNGTGYMPPSTRVFLARIDGSLITV